MPVELEAFIDAGYSDGATAFSYLVNAANKLVNAATAIGAEDWATAETRLTEAASNFSGCGKYLLQDDVFYQGLRRDWKDALYWINDNWPADGAISMDAILNAMLGASFDQLQKFIGFVDAYRVAIWNAPFNADFYAALARGFQKWQ